MQIIGADVGQYNNNSRHSVGNTLMRQSTCSTRNDEMFDVRTQLTIKQPGI
jgi:hypothetical protein